MKRLMIYLVAGFAVGLPGLPKLAVAQIPSAETNAAPAAASLAGVTYLAWKGKSSPADSIYYATSNGSGAWNAQKDIPFARTTQAPALAAVGNTLYLAWRGQSSNQTDNIFFSASPWDSQKAVCNDSICAETAAAPALAGGSTLYLAWTTAPPAGQTGAPILLATYINGEWIFDSTPAITKPGMAPALAVYKESLFLEWVQEGTAEVMYATLPLSGGEWSAAKATPASVVTAVPALGVYAQQGDGAGMNTGLYMTWPIGGGMMYSDWDDGWSAAVPIPGLPIPPGPLTPALVFITTTTTSDGGLCTLTTFAFSLAYTAGVSGQAYDDIYFHTLDQSIIHGCQTPPPTQ
jgi:hypothetical protein